MLGEILGEFMMAIDDYLRGLFYFSDGNISVVEVEKTNVDKKASLNKRYFWLWIDHRIQKIEHLKFVSMDKDHDYQYRKLGNIELKFNDDGAEVKSSAVSSYLSQKDPMQMSEAFKLEIKNFIEHEINN